jgi:hypothetical protein
MRHTNQGWWEAVVLPPWDGSKSGFGRRNLAIEALNSQSETGTGRAPAGNHKKLPNSLVTTNLVN